MVNVTKIRSLCKDKGIKMSYVCEQLGLARNYLNNVESGKNTMSEERILTVARILGTSFEYLTDLTDDPDPNFIKRSAETLEEKIIHEVMEKVFVMPKEQLETLYKMFGQSDEDFARTMEVIKAMQK